MMEHTDERLRQVVADALTPASEIPLIPQAALGKLWPITVSPRLDFGPSTEHRLAEALRANFKGPRHDR
jgi:hypothetical protein